MRTLRYTGGLRLLMTLPSGREIVVSPGDECAHMEIDARALLDRPDFEEVNLPEEDE